MSQWAQQSPLPHGGLRPTSSEPSSATAGWALGLSLLSCCFVGNIVSTFLALKVLRHSEDTGHDRGNGLAVAALTVNALTVGSIAVVLYFGLALGLFFTDTPSYGKPPVNADARVVSDLAVLEPGDCLEVPSMRGSEDPSRQVPCAGSHDAEVFYRIDFADGRFPGTKEVDHRADWCTATPFEKYVGATHDDAPLDVTYFYPTKESWRDGDRTIVCMVTDPSGPVKGSVKGSGKGSGGDAGKGDEAATS